MCAQVAGSKGEIQDKGESGEGAQSETGNEPHERVRGRCRGGQDDIYGLTFVPAVNVSAQIYGGDGRTGVDAPAAAASPPSAQVENSPTKSPHHFLPSLL